MIRKKVAIILIAASIVLPAKANAVELSTNTSQESITSENTYIEKDLKENRKVSFSSDSKIVLNKDKVISGTIGDGKNIKKVSLYINGEKLQEVLVNCNEENYNFSLHGTYKKAIEKAEAIVQVEYKDGDIIKERTILQTDKMEVLGTVDSLKNGDTLTSDKIQVRGWAAGRGGIKNIKIYYNDKLIIDSVANERREDIDRVYPSYGESNWGYNYYIPRDNNVTTHKIKIIATMEDGTSDYWNRTLNSKSLPMRGTIDTVKNGSKIVGRYLEVRGWELSSSRIKTMSAYLDGKYLGDLDIGQERLDVYRAFPDYENKNAGFSKSFHISNESAGEKTLKLVVTNEDGTVDDFVRKIKIQKNEVSKPVRGCLDTPKNGSNVSGMYLNIRGWHLSSSKMKKVEVFINGKSMGEVTPNTLRPDVSNVFPEYNNENSGFDGKVNITSEDSGTKTLRVVITNEDGTVDDFVRTINIKRPANISHIDSPTIDYDYYNNSITIRGWALSGYGIKGIHVYLDGKIYKGISTDIYRPDVSKVYPDYDEDYSGFSITIPMSGLATGQHEAKLYIITGNNTIYHPTIISGEKKENKPSVSFYNNNLNVNSHTYYGGGGWRRIVLDHAFGMRGVAYYLGGNWANAKYVTFSNGFYHFTPVSELPKTGAVPGYGLDCAGFVQRCYSMAGISIGKTTWDIVNQVKRTYTPQPGDLYFKNDLDHVGIYLKDNGDGTFTYIDCNQTWEGELKENKVRGRVEVRREKKVKDCKFYTP